MENIWQKTGRTKRATCLYLMIAYNIIAFSIICSSTDFYVLIFHILKQMYVAVWTNASSVTNDVDYWHCSVTTKNKTNLYPSQAHKPWSFSKSWSYLRWKCIESKSCVKTKTNHSDFTYIAIEIKHKWWSLAAHFLNFDNPFVVAHSSIFQILHSYNKWASWRTSTANTLVDCAPNYDFIRRWQCDRFYLWFFDYLGVSCSSLFLSIMAALKILELSLTTIQIFKLCGNVQSKLKKVYFYQVKNYYY